MTHIAEKLRFAVGDYIDEVIAAWGQPDYIDRGLDFNPQRRWVNYAGYRYRGFVFTYLDNRRIIEVDEKEPATGPEDADVRPKSKYPNDVLTSMKHELIDGHGLRSVTSDGETVDIKFGEHRDTVRAEFGFPDKRQVVDGPNYHPSETTIHETYNGIRTTFVYGFTDKRVRESGIITLGKKR